MRKTSKSLEYKRIYVGDGYIYVFKVWAGGVIACYCGDSPGYSHPIKTKIMNHSITDKPSGRFLVITPTRGKPIEVLLSRIRKQAWRMANIDVLSELSGINIKTLGSLAVRLGDINGIRDANDDE